MSERILITPRSLTQGRSPELQLLEDAGYELVYARPGQTPTEDEVLASADLLSLHCPPAPGGRPVMDRETLARVKVG